MSEQYPNPEINIPPPDVNYLSLDEILGSIALFKEAPLPPTSSYMFVRNEFEGQGLRSFRRQQQAREMLNNGDIPLLDNEFQFVIDRRPEGHEKEYIPASIYTGYFSKRQIPIADIGHRLRDHDIGHIPSYQDMFSNKTLADLVPRAAANALTDPDLCKEFAKAMDGLGDSMRNLGEGSAYTDDVSNANIELSRLIELGAINVVEDPDRDQALFDELWTTLELDYYKKIAHDRLSYIHLQ